MRLQVSQSVRVFVGSVIGSIKLLRRAARKNKYPANKEVRCARVPPLRLDLAAEETYSCHNEAVTSLESTCPEDLTVSLSATPNLTSTQIPEGKAYFSHTGTSDAITSPPTHHILFLPDELLSNIFILCIPDLVTKYKPFQDGCLVLIPSQPHPNTVRRSLTQVCRRWRIVAVNTPLMWTTLILGRALKWDYENLEKWLGYSRTYPLDVCIRSSSWTGTKTRVSSLMRLLRAEVGRIRSFMAQHLHGEELLELFPLGFNQVAELPSMEILYVREYSGPPQLGADSEPVVGHIYSPSLEYLELAEARLLPSLMTTSFLPLRYLVLGATKFPVPASTYLQFLACCPLLYSFWYFNEMPHYTPGQPMWPNIRITLSALCDFRFFADHNSDTMFFLRSLHLPMLKSLRFGEYDGAPHASEFLIQVYWHLLTATAPTLEYLMLSHQSLPIGDNIVGSFLMNMTNLTTLVFHDVHLRSEVFESLIPGPHDLPGQWPCPRLTDLTLKRVDIEGDVFAKLIKARTWSDEEYRRRFRDRLTRHGWDEDDKAKAKPTTTDKDIVDKSGDRYDGTRNKEASEKYPGNKSEGQDEDKDKQKDMGVSEDTDQHPDWKWGRDSDSDENSIIAFGDYGTQDGRLKRITIYNCSFLEEETFAEFVNLKRTHSWVLRVYQLPDYWPAI